MENKGVYYQPNSVTNVEFTPFQPTNQDLGLEWVRSEDFVNMHVCLIKQHQLETQRLGFSMTCRREDLMATSKLRGINTDLLRGQMGND